MRKAILLVLIALLLSGCVLMETASYTLIERVPVVPPITATAKQEKPAAWYESLAAGVGSLIALEPLQSLWVNLRLTITDTTESISNAVSDVKRGTNLKMTKVKYSAIGGNENRKIEVGPNGVKKE